MKAFERIISLCVDIFIILVINILISMISEIFGMDFGSRSELHEITSIDYVVVIYCFVIPLFLKGASLGNKLVGIRIVSTLNLPLSRLAIVKRSSIVLFFMWFLPTLILFHNWFMGPTIAILYYLGYIFLMMITKDKRFLHDIIAGTRVDTVK